MAKKPTISTISSGYASNTQLNNNFSALRTGFDNTLSLDGSTPNAMNADFDMNSNDILNAQTVNAEALRLDGVLVSSSSLAASGATLFSTDHTGDGTTVAYSTTYQAFIKDNTQVYIDGVYQNKAGYSISGTTLTFSEAPPLNAAIEIVVARSLDVAATDAANVGYEDINNVYTGDTVATVLDEIAYKHKTNYNWMGFFRTWQNGHAFKVLTGAREIGASGSTFARLNFVDDDVTMYHVNGTYQPDAIRVQRNNTNTATDSATMVMNFTQAETKPLLGKQICVQFHGKKSSTYTGSSIAIKVNYSKEPEQPIVNDTGSYSNSNVVLVQDTISLGTSATSENVPHYVTATLPADATQVAITFEIPWSGTAGTDDYVDLEGVFLTIGNKPSYVINETFVDLISKAQTRYQTSYTYGSPRGVRSKSGAIRVSANGTSTSSAVIAKVDFNPPMVVLPQVLMQSPLSGTENRWENETTGVFVNGLPYNLNSNGVTFQNNGAVSDGDVLLCHWTARCVF